MSVDKVREYLRSYGLGDRIKEFDISPPPLRKRPRQWESYPPA